MNLRPVVAKLNLLFTWSMFLIRGVYTYWARNTPSRHDQKMFVQGQSSLWSPRCNSCLSQPAFRYILMSWSILWWYQVTKTRFGLGVASASCPTFVLPFCAYSCTSVDSTKIFYCTLHVQLLSYPICFVKPDRTQDTDSKFSSIPTACISNCRFNSSLEIVSSIPWTTDGCYLPTCYFWEFCRWTKNKFLVIIWSCFGARYWWNPPLLWSIVH